MIWLLYALACAFFQATNDALCKKALQDSDEYIITLVLITHCLAIYQIEAAYMISVKRLSLLISVSYGGLFFQESHILQRLLEAFFMVMGIFLIAFL